MEEGECVLQGWESQNLTHLEATGLVTAGGFPIQVSQPPAKVSAYPRPVKTQPIPQQSGTNHFNMTDMPVCYAGVWIIIVQIESGWRILALLSEMSGFGEGGRHSVYRGVMWK